ncbi:MAG: hypothetical protein ACRDYX_00750 [Egibacteraceae bacterium]
MKVLFFTYFFIREDGQSLIGDYKQFVRVAKALSDRGHEIVIAHVGSENYPDELTEKRLNPATAMHLQYFDAKNQEMELDQAGHNRNTFLEQFAAVRPDLVVLGGAPWSGMFLEAALCAAELRIPLAVLDNAYGPSLISQICIGIGPMIDGLALTGPSSFHLPQPPAHLLQVSPFVELGPESERVAAMKALGLTGDRLITVFGAYDSKVVTVALGLATQLKGSSCEMVFLSPRQPEVLKQRLATLDTDVKVKVIPSPSESMKFDLLHTSRLAIIKYGFKQMTEAMSLRTPVLVVYHDGPHWLQYTPIDCHKFIYVTTDADTGPEVAAAARKLMDTDKEEMAPIHAGGFAAAEETARFLEKLYVGGVRDTSAECAEHGFSQQLVTAALVKLEHCDHVSIQSLRCTQVMPLLKDPERFALFCSYTAAGQQRTARLKGTVYSSTGRARSDLATSADQDRRMLYASADRRVVLELMSRGTGGAVAHPSVHGPDHVMESL